MGATSFKRSQITDFDKYRSLLVGNSPTLEEPDFLSSAPMWFDASDLSTITETSGNVSQWDNKGTGPDFVQSTSSLQPRTGDTTINGLNVIDFTDNKMQSTGLKSDWTFLHDGTVFFLAFALKIGVQTDSILANILDNSDYAGGSIGFTFNTDQSEQLRFRINPDSLRVAENFFMPVGDGVYSGFFEPSKIPINERATYFRNYTQGTDENGQDSTPTSSDSTEILTIGRRPRDQELLEFVGSYAEMIIVSGSDATESNRQTVVNYLNKKWGII